MRSFYDGDGYVSLPLYFRFFDIAVSASRYKNYTPDLFEVPIILTHFCRQFITVFGGLAKLFLPAPKPLEKGE